MTLLIKKIIYWIPIIGVLILVYDSFKMPITLLKKNVYKTRNYVYIQYPFSIILFNVVVHLISIFILVNFII